MTLWILFGLSLLAGFLTSAYYRSRAIKAEKVVETIADVRDEWLATNKALTEKLDKAQAALRARQETERKNDLAEVEAAGTDASAVADLLNRP